MTKFLDAPACGAEITQIVQDVFAMMVGTAVEPSDQTEEGGEDITARVHFEGSWRGAAILECGEGAARRFCARLMKVPEPSAVDDDVLDAMGELINMVGGNLKSVLPRGVVLSPPAVFYGADGPLAEMGSSREMALGFQCEVGSFRLKLAQLPDERVHAPAERDEVI